MKKSLLNYFEELSDYRRGAGQRHSQELSLIIIVMSLMSGYIGIRAMGDFVERNRDDLIKFLKPKKPRVPSYSTLRRILLHLDFKELKQVFTQWSSQYVEIAEYEYLALDGKGIKSTVKDYNSEMQDFISLVSVFSQKRKQVLNQQFFHSKKASEIPIVQELLQELDLEGKTVTLDALHCQKNSKIDC
jgi:hypothetical protein